MSVYKIKIKKKSPPPKIYRIFPFYQLTCKPLLCSPNQKIIIETQFNPVASHHLNLLEKKNMQKNILKRSFAKNTIKSSKKSFFWRSTWVQLFKKIKNPILNLRLLKFNIFWKWTPIFWERKRNVTLWPFSPWYFFFKWAFRVFL